MRWSLFMALMLMVLQLKAQITDPSQVPGKISGETNGTVLKGTSAAAKALNASLLRQLNAAKRSKWLAKPLGFELSIDAHMPTFQPQLGDKRYRASLALFLPHYVVGGTGFLKKVDESAASITLYSNPEDFLTRTAGYFEARDGRVGIPHPFQRIPVTDSTDDYIEYSFRNYPFREGYYRDFSVRVIRRNPRPVFVPFSRRQYLEYLISLENLKIKENREKMDDFGKQIAELLKTQQRKDVKEEYKKFIPQSLKGLEDAVTNCRKREQEFVQQIANYEKGIASMEPAAASEVAYINLDGRKHSETAYLAEPDKTEGWPLYVVNPDYYDDSLPPLAVQAIMAVYWYGKSAPEFLRTRTKEAYEGIDYHALKLSMR